MFFYKDNEDKGEAHGFDISKVDPHKAYLKHAANWFYLKFMYGNGTLPEKFRASLELVICERKMKFWSSKPNFDPTEVTKSLKGMKDLWNQPFTVGEYTDEQLKWFKSKGIKT